MLLSYNPTFSVTKVMKEIHHPTAFTDTSVSSVNKGTPQLAPLACSQKDWASFNKAGQVRGGKNTTLKWPCCTSTTQKHADSLIQGWKYGYKYPHMCSFSEHWNTKLFLNYHSKLYYSSKEKLQAQFGNLDPIHANLIPNLRVRTSLFLKTSQEKAKIEKAENLVKCKDQGKQR